MIGAEVRLTEGELNALEGAVMSRHISVQQVVEAIVSTRLAVVESERNNAQRVASHYQRQFKRAAEVIGADDRLEAWDSLPARTEKAEAVRDRLEHALNIMQMHEIDNRRLRDGIAALASSYAQYETDVWGADVASNLRALLAEERAL